MTQSLMDILGTSMIYAVVVPEFVETSFKVLYHQQ